MGPWGPTGIGSGTAGRDDEEHVRRIVRWHELWAGEPGDDDRGGT